MTNDLKEVTVTPEQVELIKKTVADGATDAELQLFIYDCKRRGVHPLDRMIHFTKRKGKYVPIVGIDYMRSRAQSTNELVGIEEPVFSGKPGEADFKATVTLYRLQHGEKIAYSGTARWPEFYPGDEVGFMWKKMKHHMLAKCAEALAFRKAFANELQGLYSEEELGPKAMTVELTEPQAIQPEQGQTTEPIKEVTEAPTAKENIFADLKAHLETLLSAADVLKWYDAIKDMAMKDLPETAWTDLVSLVNKRVADIAKAKKAK